LCRDKEANKYFNKKSVQVTRDTQLSEKLPHEPGVLKSDILAAAVVVIRHAASKRLGVLAIRIAGITKIDRSRNLPHTSC
jgi:hypothetical protein